MRRALTTLSVLLAASPPLAAPWQAAAAVGSVVVEAEGVARTKLSDPAAGCHPLPRFRLMSRVTVTNGTNADVIIYSGPDCKTGLLRAASRVRAGSTSVRTLTGTHSLQVLPTA